jgi:hypothetical protein
MVVFPLAFFRDGSFSPYRRLLAFTAWIWRQQPFSPAGSRILKELTFRQERRYAGSMRPTEETSDNFHRGWKRGEHRSLQVRTSFRGFGRFGSFASEEAFNNYLVRTFRR